MSSWAKGGVFDNINTFANSLGYENANIAIPLGMIPWKSVEDRDAFVRALTGADPVGSDTQYFSDVKKKGGTK